jgi:hypothetical protein
MATAQELYPLLEQERDTYRQALEGLQSEGWLDEDPCDSRHLADAKKAARNALAKFNEH